MVIVIVFKGVKNKIYIYIYLYIILVFLHSLINSMARIRRRSIYRQRRRRRLRTKKIKRGRKKQTGGILPLLPLFATIASAFM